MSVEYTLKLYDMIECDGIRYRILGIRDQIITIQMEISSRVFRLFETGKQFDADILSGRLRIIKKEESCVIPKMSSVCQAAYDLNKKITDEITELFGKDSFLSLSGKKLKRALVELREKYQVSKHKMNRLITKWLQSGCDSYALLDHRTAGIRKANGPYTYEKRPGRKNKKENETSTAVLDDVLRKLFDEIIHRKLEKKTGFFSTFFRDVMNEYFSSSLKLNGEYRISKEDSVCLPTLRQFYYYLSTHSGVTDKDRYIAEHSEQEYRNNCRERIGDTVKNTYGIGDRMEVDIVDIDVILKAIGFQVAVGRPHLYLLIDILTRIIPGFYVSYTNNSVTGLQGLLHNLGEDKVELCGKYGIEIKEDEWPSGFYPGSCFVDNGSDFASNQIMELFSRIGIERNLEPPAMGSMKGTIEQLFHQFYLNNKDLLEKHGVILKRHDSNHYEEASLDMDDIIKIVILFIISHNKQYMSEYPVTREMLDEDVECSPINLFNYFKERFPLRQITDTHRYQLDCMFEAKASVKRGEIVFRKHHYVRDPKDSSFTRDFTESMDTSYVKVRYTRLSGDYIFYEHDGKWYRAELNNSRTDEASFRGLTRDQLESYDDQKLSNDNIGARKNVIVIGNCRSEIKETIAQAEQKKSYSVPVSEDNKQEIIQKEKQSVLTKSVPSMASNRHQSVPHPGREQLTVLTDMDWDKAMEDLYI